MSNTDNEMLGVDIPEYIEFSELYKRYCQCKIGTRIKEFYEMSFFEVTCNLEAYKNDFEFQALPLELQTKWLVSCNGFVKINGFEKVQFFKKENNIKVKKEDEELFNFLDKIRIKNKLSN